MDEINGEDSAAEPSALTMIAASFHDPAIVGASVARQGLDRRAWLAMLLLVSLMVVATSAVLPQISAMGVEQMRSNRRIPPDRAAAMAGMFATPKMRAIMVVSGVLGALLGLVVVAGLLYLGQLTMGGEATFAGCLAVMAFTGWIGFGIGYAAKMGLVLLKDSFNVATGLGVLTLDRPQHDALRAVFDGFDVFVVWGVWAAGVALVQPARISRRVAFSVSVATFLVATGLQVGVKLVGAIFG